ncbi:hypothetical protein DENSPDRAFT_835721 [Dentipellis sp. KUC8613]|nr:hypothetical protein DENSPDRAFT_835721 [Dentipellis sp. KUC8613]
MPPPIPCTRLAWCLVFGFYFFLLTFSLRGQSEKLVGGWVGWADGWKMKMKRSSRPSNISQQRVTTTEGSGGGGGRVPFCLQQNFPVMPWTEDVV